MCVGSSECFLDPIGRLVRRTPSSSLRVLPQALTVPACTLGLGLKVVPQAGGSFFSWAPKSNVQRHTSAPEWVSPIYKRTPTSEGQTVDRLQRCKMKIKESITREITPSSTPRGCGRRFGGLWVRGSLLESGIPS